jgi:hypothetical protein
MNLRLLESDPLSPKNKIEADTNGEFRTSLEKSPLAFSFQDGRIEELCTSRPEKTWVLNIAQNLNTSRHNILQYLDYICIFGASTWLCHE